jgi:hypothetical protein
MSTLSLTEFLRQPLADVARCSGAVVLYDQLDLAAAERVAVDGEVEFDPVLDLFAVGGERTGHRQHQPDLHRIGGEGGKCAA